MSPMDTIGVEERERIARDELDREDPAYRMESDFLIDFLAERYVFWHPRCSYLVMAEYADAASPPSDEEWRDTFRICVAGYRHTWLRTERKREKAGRRRERAC